jgi:hypothetical protein
MGDITNPKLLYVKAALFLIAGATSASILVWKHPSLQVVLLLAIAIWCFSRAYYFAFYVVQHYIDPSYRFAGLLDFARYAVNRRRARNQD